MKQFWSNIGKFFTIVYTRLNAETPVFFKWIIRVALTASAGAVALLASGYQVSPHLHTVCENIAVAGVVAAAISKATKTDTNDTSTGK